MPRNPPREDRRVIAIQMLPGAYTEIQRLKGEETWTKFIIECVIAKVGDNNILKDELASLTKEPKKAAVEAEVPSAEEAERVEVEGEKTLIMPHTHKPKAEKEANPVEPRTLPSPEQLAQAGISTPAMGARNKGKTLQ